MKYIIYQYILKPLIKRNYKLRMKDERPDTWYWADELACKWGYRVRINIDGGPVTPGKTKLYKEYFSLLYKTVLVNKDVT